MNNGIDKLTTAMILCAGFGSRISELTKETPKPMLLINNKPMLEYTISHLAKLQITNIIINLHYLPEKITSYFKDGQNFNVNIKYIYEKELLGTAGAVKNAQKLLDPYENFLVLYGDVVTNQNYLEMFKFHNSIKNNIATIILHQRKNSNSVVEIDENNKIVKFIERPIEKILDKKQDWVNSGLYLFNKKIFDYIPKDQFCDFPKDVFGKLVSIGKIYGYPLNGYRCAVDSYERYEKLKQDIINGICKF